MTGDDLNIKMSDNDLINIGEKILKKHSETAIIDKNTIIMSKKFKTDIMLYYDKKNLILNEIIKNIIDIEQLKFPKNYLFLLKFHADKLMSTYKLDSMTKYKRYYREKSLIELLNECGDKYNMCEKLTQYTCYFKIKKEENINIIINIGNMNFIFHLIKNKKIKITSVIKKIIDENMQNNIKKNISSKLKNDKYDNDSIDELFYHNMFKYIISILDCKNIVEEFKFEKSHLSLLCKNNKYNTIIDYIKINKIFVNQDNFNIIIKTEYNNGLILYYKSLTNIDIINENFINLIKIFIEDKKIQLDLHNFDVCENYININFKEIIKYIINKIDREEYTNYHLQLACKYGLRESIILILNYGIIPTQKCYKSLFANTYNDVPYFVDLFCACGYKLLNDDILFATQHKIILNDCSLTRKFIPTNEFYELCDINFMPNYNNKMYKDNLWVEKVGLHNRNTSCLIATFTDCNLKKLDEN
jgi:hypothetical protein